MDAKLQVSLLQEHNEQLRKLTTALGADLSKLRLALSEQDRSSDTEGLSLLVELAELNQSLFVATDLFAQHLHKLLSKAKKGNGLTEGDEAEQLS